MFSFDGHENIFGKKVQANGGSIEKIVTKGQYMYLVSKDNKDKPLETNCNYFLKLIMIYD